MSEDIDAKNLTHGPPRPVHDSSSSFECLLCEWNVWLRLRYFYKAGIKYNYDPDGIIFSVGLCHVRVSASLCDLQNKRTLLRLYVGDWTALPPFQDVPFMALAEENAGVEQIWNSPPAEDQNFREIEMTQKESDENNSSGCCVV
ncbi:hypothetical protein M405DRAFT_935906 [Rhizopogon salebrosus TDB-379]|nr:hypothetical protein M405DRAFT_935906 [Rhizopogon salebrosus TDB-379]